MANNASSSSGIGFFGLLTIAFIVLKLMHYIDWSWWWILAPSWIPLSLLLLFLAFCLVMAIVTKQLRWGR